MAARYRPKYRCLLCGAPKNVDKEFEFPSSAEIDDLLKAIKGTQNNLTLMGLDISEYEVHYCEDGNVGKAILAGFERIW